METPNQTPKENLPVWAGMNVFMRIACIYDQMPAILKTGTNAEQHYAFIEQAAIVAALRLMFAKYNLVLTCDMHSQPTVERLTNTKGNPYIYATVGFIFTLRCADKPEDKFTSSPWYAEAKDSSDKALNKLSTAAQKYWLIRTFLISDIDPDEFGEPEDRVRRETQSRKAPSTWADHVINLPQSKKGLHKKRMSDLQDAQFELLRDHWLPTINPKKCTKGERELVENLRAALADKGMLLKEALTGDHGTLLSEIESRKIPVEEFLKCAMSEGWIDMDIQAIGDIPADKAKWILEHLSDCMDQVDFVP